MLWKPAGCRTTRPAALWLYGYVERGGARSTPRSNSPA